MTVRRVMLVTGGSSGIGAATVRMAARAGYDVALAYARDRAGAAGVVAEAEAAGVRAVALGADLAAPGGPDRLFEAFDAAFGQLDVLVNNAGAAGAALRVDEMDRARIEATLALNVTAPFLCAGMAVHRMSTRYGGDGGVIVNVSSAAARIGGANTYVDYAASKAAIDILTKGLSDEVAAEGIRVAGVRPGIIETPFHERAGDAGRVARLAGAVPLQRPGSAAEVAAAILWLASDAASYVTGTTLDVTGGR